MAEQREKAPKAPRTSTRQTKQATTTSTTKRGEPSLSKKARSVSFQIRTAPDIKTLAERVASDHSVGGRSKIDGDVYKRGLLLTMLLLGPGRDGAYAGQSELEIARQLEPFFDRLYAVLDKHQLLASYVYRVLPPGGVVGGIAYMQPVAQLGGQNSGQELQAQVSDNLTSYTLSEEAKANLENFAEEI